MIILYFCSASTFQIFPYSSNLGINLGINLGNNLGINLFFNRNTRSRHEMHLPVVLSPFATDAVVPIHDPLIETVHCIGMHILLEIYNHFLKFVASLVYLFHYMDFIKGIAINQPIQYANDGVIGIEQRDIVDANRWIHCCFNKKKRIKEPINF
jgi:hypothetical protein